LGRLEKSSRPFSLAKLAAVQVTWCYDRRACLDRSLGLLGELMRQLLLCAALLSAASSPAVAQDEAKTKNDKPVIVVEGCVDGSWLRVQKADPIGSYAERYRLHGSKYLIKELTKKYNGHFVQVTGAVTDTGNTTHRGKVIPVGKKTRIYTGAKEVPTTPAGTLDPILEVDSYRELKGSCK
jgi:hypothetical protein